MTTTVEPGTPNVANALGEKLPITMLGDRVLVRVPEVEGERRSRAGILIPATAHVAKRLVWATAVAVGPHVRTVRVSERVLFNPEETFEVEVGGDTYLILRERDIQAVATERLDSGTGLYLLSSIAPTSRPGVPIRSSQDELAHVRYDANGLVCAVVQEWGTREVLMVGYMNEESLQRTLQTGRTWFWSRSRQEFWCKGETSGDRQYVRKVSYDCDGDALLVEVDQEGRGACHTGEVSCFYRAFGEAGAV